MAKASSKKSSAKKASHNGDTMNSYERMMAYWGLFLLIIGGYQFGAETGVFAADVPFWPIVAMVFGSFALVKGFLFRSE